MLMRAVAAQQFVEIYDTRLIGDFGVPLPTLEKGNRGEFFAFACRQRPQIPLSPPFPKGEMARKEFARI